MNSWKTGIVAANDADSNLLRGVFGCGTPSLGSWCPTFQNSVVVSWIFRPLKLWARCLETSGANPVTHGHIWQRGTAISKVRLHSNSPPPNTRNEIHLRPSDFQCAIFSVVVPLQQFIYQVGCTVNSGNRLLCCSPLTLPKWNMLRIKSATPSQLSVSLSYTFFYLIWLCFLFY